jgi:hypothetical protein
MPAATTSEKMRRIYIILRWYDRYVDAQENETPEEDTKLAMELELEMLELQRKSFEKEVKKKRKKYGKQTSN